VLLEVKTAEGTPGAQPQTFGPGYPLGAQSFIVPGPRLFTSTALTDIKALHWKAQDWETICNDDPRVGFHICREIGKWMLYVLRGSRMGLLNQVEWGLE